MELVDVHCHIDRCEQGALERAREDGVQHIITNGLNPENNRTVQELADQHDVVEAALGLYPNESLELNDHIIEEELSRIKQVRPIAVGECGLDYTYDADQDRMRRWFREQLRLAQDIDRPVIIHSRRAEGDVLELLEEVGNDKVVLHAFQGNKSQIRRAIDAGHHFSIPSLAVRSEHFQMLAEMAPAEQLLTETDSPYMSPDRGEENEPKTVREGIEAIAAVREETSESIADQIHENYHSLFDR